MASITVCLPNYNNREYLPELLDSVCAQTFTDWELLMVDYESEDGAWDYLQLRAAAEPRMKLSRSPRVSLYANWNHCLSLATGEFVYIATSDDKLAPDCLEKLHAALVRHPECGVAHCPPLIFGEGSEAVQRWWREESPLSLSVGGRLDRAHIRRAPFDGLLHVAGQSVIVSVTQMLVRRTVFARVGNFPTDAGVTGDFEWQARAALLFDGVYVPDTWGGWRLHSAQATAKNRATLAEKALVNAGLFERALDFYLTTPEGARNRQWVERLRDGARLHATHLGGRGVGRSRTGRIVALIRGAKAVGWGRLLAGGPHVAFRLALSPVKYWIAAGDRALGRKCVEWL